MIEEILQKKAKLVDESIPKFLPITPPDELYKAMRHLLDAGGKRLRPSALLLAAEAVGGKPEDVLPAAVAVELVHNFTLIHDDIMDEADLRRGLTTVHKKWGVPRATLPVMLCIQKLLRSFHVQKASHKDSLKVLSFCLRPALISVKASGWT
jgi:geranylgeranyl diphosphate synthase type I